MPAALASDGASDVLPDENPKQHVQEAVKTCHDCKIALGSDNTSILRLWCQKCFDRNVAERRSASEACLTRRESPFCGFVANPFLILCLTILHLDFEIVYEDDSAPPLPPPDGPPEQEEALGQSHSSSSSVSAGDGGTSPSFEVTDEAPCGGEHGQENESRVALLQLSALAQCAQGADPLEEPEAASIDVWRGRPARVSWRTWFQTVCYAVGAKFDGKGMTRKAALADWLAMGDYEKDCWKESYQTWCAKQQCLPAAAAADPKTPEKRSAVESAPQSSEKRIGAPTRMVKDPGSESLTRRIDSLDAFHAKWKGLKKEIAKKGLPSFFLSNARRMYFLYLDIVRLLDAGYWGGSAERASIELQAYHVNPRKLCKVRSHVSCAGDKGLREVPRSFSAGRGMGTWMHGTRAALATGSKRLARHSRQPHLVSDQNFYKVHCICLNPSSHQCFTCFNIHRLVARPLFFFDGRAERRHAQARDSLRPQQQTAERGGGQKEYVPLLPHQCGPGEARC